MSKSLIPMAVGLLVGAIAGAGAMTLFGGGDAPALSAQALTRDTRRAGADDANGSFAPTPATVDPAVSAARIERATSSTAIPSELSEGVGELIRRAPEQNHATGDKTLKGRVVDARGNAMAGVVLRAVRTGDAVPAKPNVAAIGRSAPPPPTLEEAVRAAISGWYESGGEYHQVETGGDGRYELAALRDGQYQLSIWKDGWVFDSEHGRGEASVRPDATIDWNGKTVRAQALVVKLPDGSGAPCANLEYRKQGRDDSEGWQGWLASQPTIMLEPGRWDVRATLGHPQSGPAWPEYMVSAWQKIAIVEGEAGEAITLTLEGKPGLRGRVVLSTGGSPPQALIKLKRLEPGERADPDAMKDNDDEGGSIQTQWINGGEFSFVDLKAGHFLLTAQRFWNAPILVHAEVDIAEKMVENDLVMPELDVATCIVATVRATDGTLLPEANFQWRFDRGSGGSNHNDCTADRREVGVWWLPLEAAKQGDFDPLGAWPSDSHLYLIVSHADYGATAVEVFGATRNVDIKFGPPATLVVTVPGFAGSDFDGQINFGLNRIGKGIDSVGWGAGGQPNKEEGLARLGPVEAGRWKLVMWMSSSKRNRWNQFEAASADITLTPGENQATMSMPTLYSLILRVPEGVEGQINMEQSGKNQGRRWIYGEVNKDGGRPQVTFDDIPAGDYRVTLNNGPNPGVMTISVPSGGIVEWSPAPINALRVVFGDKPEGAAGLGFHDGDLITSIDGKEVASSVDLQVLWTLARASRELELVLQRGDAPVTLKVKGEDLMKQLRNSASIEAATR